MESSRINGLDYGIVGTRRWGYKIINVSENIAMMSKNDLWFPLVRGADNTITLLTILSHIHTSLSNKEKILICCSNGYISSKIRKLYQHIINDIKSEEERRKSEIRSISAIDEQIKILCRDAEELLRKNEYPQNQIDGIEMLNKKRLNKKAAEYTNNSNYYNFLKLINNKSRLTVESITDSAKILFDTNSMFLVIKHINKK